jgi:hypothetical protein
MFLNLRKRAQSKQSTNGRKFALSDPPVAQPPLKTALWDRCYDHNFLRFLTIFGEKIGVFHKNQCYDQNFA